jgi:hypothetical protein
MWSSSQTRYNKIEARWNTIKHKAGKLYVTEELQSRPQKECKTKNPNTIANFFNDIF